MRVSAVCYEGRSSRGLVDGHRKIRGSYTPARCSCPAQSAESGWSKGGDEGGSCMQDGPATQVQMNRNTTPRSPSVRP